MITEPMPSMPLFFWGDEDGERYRESYFDMYPGVWRHGDWIEITERGTAIISGRSDSTINRGGIRMGTAEIYRAVLALDEVTDALVVDVPREGEENFMPLFVVLREGAALDDALVEGDPARIREDCSPRHVPERDRDASRRCRGRCRARCSSCRSRGSSGHRPTRRPAATRSPTRRRWTSSSSTRARLNAPARPGGSRPSVDSQEPARISSRPAIAPAPGPRRAPPSRARARRPG